jgi:hypothetical protein
MTQKKDIEFGYKSEKKYLYSRIQRIHYVTTWTMI